MEKEPKMENMVIKKKSIVEDDLKFINQKIKNKKFFRNKKIIIFGSEGFIGFYLKKYFIKYFQELKVSELILADKKIRKTKYISKKIKELVVVEQLQIMLIILEHYLLYPNLPYLASKHESWV